jgi:hypothetical protein
MNRVEKLASRYLVGTAPLPPEVEVVRKGIRAKHSLFIPSSRGYFLPLFETPIVLERAGKQYELFDWGLHVYQDEGQWWIKSAHLYLMHPYTVAEPKAVKNSKSTFVQGSLEDYIAAYTKVTVAQKKALTVFKQFLREQTDEQKNYAKKLKEFIAKWTKGQTWGQHKNVVPMDLDWVHPSTREQYKLGVIFNLALLRMHVNPNKHWIDTLDENRVFRLVWENKATGEVEASEGFDLLSKYHGKLSFLPELESAIQTLNRTILIPWGGSLGQQI